MARFTVIRGGLLLDAPAHAASARDILIDGDTILEIGQPGLAVPGDVTEIDASGRLLIPGLINAHTHGNGNLAKGMGDRWTLETLLNAGIFINGHRTDEDKYLSCLLGGLEMIRSGTTACYDLLGESPLPTVEGFHAAARGYDEAGVRVLLAPMVGDHNVYTAIPGLIDSLSPSLRAYAERYESAPTDQMLAAVTALLRGWRSSSPRITLAMAPTVPLYCSDRFITGCRDLARDAGMRLQMHVGESKAEAVGGIRRYGKTLTAHLDEIGFLGPDVTAAHGVWLDDEDMARMAHHGVAVAHNPGSNLRLGCGIAPAGKLRARGVPVGVGTDGSHCADGQNMFLAMRTTSLACRITSADYREWLATEEVVSMATEGSARTMGMENSIGRLVPGYKADIVFLDLGHVNFVPLNDPTNQVVTTENGASVDSVMIGGRLVLDRGRFPHVDFERLRRRIEERVADLRALNTDDRRIAALLEPAVGSYCVGLAREPYHIERRLPQ